MRLYFLIPLFCFSVFFFFCFALSLVESVMSSAWFVPNHRIEYVRCAFCIFLLTQTASQFTIHAAEFVNLFFLSARTRTTLCLWCDWTVEKPFQLFLHSNFWEKFSEFRRKDYCTHKTRKIVCESLEPIRDTKKNSQRNNSVFFFGVATTVWIFALECRLLVFSAGFR